MGDVKGLQLGNLPKQRPSLFCKLRMSRAVKIGRDSELALDAALALIDMQLGILQMFAKHGAIHGAVP